ncbi:hypothetical protein DCAR_0625511 [Daucus carota subsp. sativus]|uniref:PHD-type domain-containing protein n=1 Tax=Daucus carota subsp. sativus TaxID=79200 RepID=A0AAF0XDT9_DAUCS|nr:hypothetical protein DCAR_0625511 [Daucus carota subsp. sativus]
MTVKKQKKLSGHTFRALFKRRAVKAKRPDTPLVVPDSVADFLTELSASSEIKRYLVLIFRLSNLDNTKEDASISCNLIAPSEAELSCCTKSKLYLDIGSRHHRCANCMNGGTLLKCSGQGCKRRFHLSCVNPSLSYVPPGVWHCSWCTDRKIKFGMYSVSEGIESIWDARPNTQGQKEYLVKYKALAHVHNRWLSEAQLISEAPEFFRKLKRINQIKENNVEWTVPDRLLDKRLIVLPENDSNVSDCHYEWLVKWKCLGYSQATWELENASFMRTPGVMKLMDNFENRHKKSDRVVHSPEKSKGRGRTFTELSKMPLQGSPDICNFNLTYVNKLREYWHRSQHCLIIDNQERVVKVVLFILSFQRCLKQPFLIITAASDLPLWVAQFSRWASSENIVVYMGNKDIRSSIKTLEFYNEGGCIMFQVLLTLPQVVAEDVEVLEAIKWEAIIIDECQRRSVSNCLTQVKMLAVNMRLFTASHEIKDKRLNYEAMLSLLDPKFDQPSQQTEPNLEFCDLKKRLAPFVAFECNYGMSKFAEYWVPVHLSNVQIEQYCESLLSNTLTLCSNAKIDSVNSLRELLILTRKCCDHPFLVDHSVQSFLATSLPVSESYHLDLGIKISGKLQLLDKILTEAKERSLKVLVMFQSLGGSGQIYSVGDILSDFVHQQFGQESYTRIDREIIRLKKYAPQVINMEDGGKFVCLIESRACCSRVKFSSLDMVILFGSDWNPKNDLRALEKITIDSQFDQIKVLRLYSSFTVEEQILVLAKQGETFDGNVMHIGRSTCHRLLTWGANYLFNKLNVIHDRDLPVLQLNNESQQSLLDDVFHELLAIFPKTFETSDSIKCSIISYVQQIEGAYKCNTMLFGEKEFPLMQNYAVIKQIMEDEPPHVLWSNLLEGKEHKWKYLPEQSPRKRKKVKYSLDLLEESATQVISSKRNCNRGISNTGNRTKSIINGKQLCSPNPPPELPERPIVEEMSRLPSDVYPVSTLPSQMSGDIIFEHGNINLQHPMTSEALQCIPLQMEMERGKQCIEQAVKICEDMKLRLISDRDKEIAEIHNKYNLLFQQAELTSKRHVHDLKIRYAKVCRTQLLARAFLQMNYPGNQDLLLATQKEGATPVPAVDDQSSMERHAVSDHIPQSDNMVNQTAVIYPAAEVTIPRIEQSLIDLRMNSLTPVTSSVEAVVLSSSVHSGARNMSCFSQLPACHVTDLQANQAMQSGRFARNQFRNNAPAPHLRHSRLSNIPISNLPTYPNILPNPQLHQNLTPVQSAFQSGSLLEIVNQRVDELTVELPELPQQLDSSNFLYSSF